MGAEGRKGIGEEQHENREYCRGNTLGTEGRYRICEEQREDRE
jgi:hypothetical protein